MGMSIDESITKYKSNAEYERTHGSLQGCVEFRQLAKWLEEYQTIKSDYNARLKADMVAMLTEIKLEIDEIAINAENSEPFKLGQAVAYERCEALIQEKINALRGNEDGEDKH